MKVILKLPETIWKSIRDRVLRSSDLLLTSEKGYDMEYIFYPYWTNSDRLLIKICKTGLDLNEVDREFAKLVPPPPPEEKTNLVLVICYFDNHPEKGYTFAWGRDFSSLYNAGNACDEDDLIDDEAEVDEDEELMMVMIFYMQLNLMGILVMETMIVLTDLACSAAIMREV